MIKNFKKDNEFSNPKDQFNRFSSRTDQRKTCRFRSGLLRDIRNAIPIRGLIETALALSNHMDSGIFRFECPQCKGFHSSVKQDTNLARCFDCRINWNTIELTMAVRKTEFRETVEFLIPILEKCNSQRVPTRLPSKSHVSIGSVIRSMPEFKINHDSKNLNCVEERLQNLEKEVEGLKKRMDQFYQFLVREVSKNRRT